ncbi:DNA-directed DNA polymerase II large subunit [Halomarina rubra]|uniref:DNA polymerase II large subunit n=1 Tax=Halomarina rubra TaxID=2071873 RepID=A0ABD6AU28_9EURY
MRPSDERYFERLESRLDEAFDVAREAKRRGGDPRPEVEIPVAKDMADRVENILGIEGVAERVRELEGEMSREEAALALVDDFVEGTVGDYDTDAGKIEGAVRTAVALLTEGVVAAPIEGIDRVEVNDNDDGTQFVSVYYAGPIRSAGGTAQALSVLVADYARALLGIDEYKARDIEVERYAEEVALYDSETGLQYTPKDKETKFIAENSPICLDGEATGQEEVSGFRDLERVDTNSPRGGMCLVLAEGIALKAPKIQRYTRNLDEVDWPWLQDLIDGTIGKDDGDEAEDAEDTEESEADAEGEAEDAPDDADDEPDGPPRVEPADKFLRDLIAGRPVFGHPSRPGGFRLRYGRARNHGFATAGVHPATMHVLDDFLATGTQIKTERPGKAGGVVPVDSIDGPTVKLANGDVRRIDDPAEALELRNGIVEILDVGEYLVNYGEFIENNHALPPASYVVEWWVQDLEHAGANLQALRDDPHVDLEDPSAEEALAWAEEFDAPLHPKYTPLWHDVSVEQVDALAAAASEGRFVEADGAALAPDTPTADEGDTLVLPRTDALCETLETLLVEHTQGEETVTVPDARPLVASLGLTDDLERTWSLDDLSERARSWPGDDGKAGGNAVEAIGEVAPFAVRERAPTRIGNRMGRPEKSEKREMSPAVHTLFPIGEAGGSQRDVSQAASYTASMRGKAGQISVQVARRECPDCTSRTFKARCPDCRTHTEAVYECHKCEVRAELDESGRALCPRCEGEAEPVQFAEIDLRSELDDALAAVGERPGVYDILKGVKGLTSEHKLPEPIEKGILRAKHGVSSFKDGTVRYDMTDLPVTSVRASELDVSVDQLRGLGYETDMDGDPLRHDDQLVELRVQDIVLSDGAAEHMLKTASFVDALLEQYYGLEPFYDVDDREDLVGELVFGMAPHTSAAVVGRVVGFTSAAVGYAHPYFHAAKRRNCFHPETNLWYEGKDGWEHGSIERFVEKYLDESTADTDDFGTLVSELDGEVRVPSVTENGEPVLKPVEAVSKHVAPDYLVEIETADGRSVTVTPDHEMLVWKAGTTRVRASELSEGDEILARQSVIDQPTDDPLAADGGTTSSEVVRVEIVRSDVDHTYCLTVADTHTVAVEGLLAGNCDGDEDCVMLLMDGLLNFSKSFLPDKRGGQMDAPLVMSSRIDPSEIDDEAHNVDIVDRYPREFYLASRELKDPEEVPIKIAEETLGTDEEYTGFRHTHDTSDIALGPDLSAYKTLGSMMDKMDAQLELARKLKAVDETDVAERVIEGHFLPDLIGNLRAFSRQETRCLDCGEKYRRMPLTGECRECGGRVNLTVHQGSVNKYMDTAIHVADEYDCRDYTKQRLEVLEQSLESVFENDKNKQSGIADFM